MATRSIPLRFNRIVELQERTVTHDSYGSEVESWSEIAQVWASVTQTGTSENFENNANRNVPKRSAQITIRWRPDVRETWRVIHVGLIWDIKGIAEIGRRAGLNLFCSTDASRKVSPGVSGQRSSPQTEEPKSAPADPPLKPAAPPKR